MTLREKYKEIYGEEPNVRGTCPFRYGLCEPFKCGNADEYLCESCWDREYVEKKVGAPEEFDCMSNDAPEKVVPAEDVINHPSHYAEGCSLECIQVMEMIFGTQNVAVYSLINAFKYMWRWKNKNGQEDLKKAEWYLKHYKENRVVYDYERVYLMLMDILKEVKK